MASNEHKNLSNDNLHVPKDFSSASASTICSKNAGSNLEWIAEGLLKVNSYKFQGYGTSPTGEEVGFYEFRNNITDGQSPYELGQSYGSGTISEETTFGTSTIFRTDGFVTFNNITLLGLRGWGTANSTDLVTIALCKVTPVDGSSSNLAPTVIDEFTFTGGGTNTTLKSFSVDAGSFTTGTASAGDIIFPMYKCAGSGKVVYFNFELYFRTT